MDYKNWPKAVNAFLLLVVMISFLSCVETLDSEQLVYSNDFSEMNLEGIENGRFHVFLNDTILGYYNNEEIALNLTDLPSHNLLKVTFEILIHDTWDGNAPDEVNGPDQWFFGIDNEEVFRTSFSNTPCEATYCLYQSYPDNFVRVNRPKAGAIQTNMPGLCYFFNQPNYTTRYSISKIIEHNKLNVRIYMNSDLVGAGPDPRCDESWSLAAIKVEALTLN